MTSLVLPLVFLKLEEESYLYSLLPSRKYLCNIKQTQLADNQKSQQNIYRCMCYHNDFSTILVLKTSSWSRFTVQQQSLILFGPGYVGRFLASPKDKKEKNQKDYILKCYPKISHLSTTAVSATWLKKSIIFSFSNVKSLLNFAAVSCFQCSRS